MGRGNENDEEITIRGGDLLLILIALFFACPFLKLKAVELSEIADCNTPNQECTIKDPQNKNIENTKPIDRTKITIKTQIDTFTNSNNITLTSNDSKGRGISIENGGKISKFINNKDGTISNGIYGQTIDELTNYGEMRGFWSMQTQTITINNHGIIKTNEGSYISGTSAANAAHFAFEASNNKITILNYKIKIIETPSEFNTYTGYHDRTNNKNSHLSFWVNTNTTIMFEDNNSKIILDFGGEFSLGEKYLLSKLITDTSGNNKLQVDFSRLALSDEIKDLYSLTNGGDSFIIRLMNKIQETPITAIYKSNIHTMNNFYTLSNAMIYPRKLYHSQNLGRTHSLLQHSPSLSTSGASGLVEYPSLQDSANQNISSLRATEYERGNSFINNITDSVLDSAIPLKSYESFAYRNESINRRIQRQNKRNYSRTKRNNNSVILSESEESQKKNSRDSSPKAQNDNVRKLQNQRFSQNLAQSPNYSQTPHNYYFILTPFINYNSFAQSGNYNLSGFDYGFLTAFSTQVAESNSLGAHFIFSYGSLGDSKDKDLSIKSLNLNLGINYKLDLIWDMYLKARGDFFYFLNQVKTLTMFEVIKPNNLGFGASVAYGKDFNFGSGGILGIEAGIDYKALQSNTISLQNNATKTISETYQKALYNLIYVDLGMSYNKYFGNFGLNAGLGIKGNITANKLAKSQIHINTFNKSVDMVLDNDNFLGYANLGASYVLNTKNFDMEFSLAYYGNFGDRVISNGGGVEFRVVF